MATVTLKWIKAMGIIVHACVRVHACVYVHARVRVCVYRGRWGEEKWVR